MTLDGIDQNHSRDFILNIHSLVHNQLTANVFIPMIQYAWFKSSYNVTDPGKFQNVREICFNYKNTFEICCRCDKTVFISCTHCNQFLCLEHFFNRTYYH